MKAKNTDPLPHLYTYSDRPAISPKTSILSSQAKQPGSFAEFLRIHKDNESVLFLENLLHRASCMSASLIYIEPEETLFRVRYRTSNELHEEIIPADQTQFDLKELLNALYGSNENCFLPRPSRTMNINFDELYFDLKIMPLLTAWGLSLTLGLQKKIRFAATLDELEIPKFTLKQLRDILNTKSGFVLLTGPRSCGKNFTLLAMLQELNTPNSKIISFEENPKVQIPRVSHLSAHNSVNNSDDIASHILQQAPDICSTDYFAEGDILIPLLNATLNNTMLLASCHAPAAIDALEQLFSLGCKTHIVAQSLRGILIQQDFSKVCPNCKKVHHLSTTEKNWIMQNFPGEAVVEGGFTIGEGCEKCANSGVAGSRKVYELIRNSEELSEAIVEGSRASLTTAISLRKNFQSVKQKAFSLAKEGVIPIQHVMTVL